MKNVLEMLYRRRTARRAAQYVEGFSKLIAGVGLIGFSLLAALSILATQVVGTESYTLVFLEILGISLVVSVAFSIGVRLALRGGAIIDRLEAHSLTREDFEVLVRGEAP